VDLLILLKGLNFACEHHIDYIGSSQGYGYEESFTDTSEQSTVSIFRVEKKAQQPARSKKILKMEAVLFC
jgi:hypothetical protein